MKGEYVGPNNSAMFCENIRILARKNGIRIRDLESDCGLSQGYLAKYVTDKHSVPLNVAIDLIRYIDDKDLINIEDIYDYDLGRQSKYAYYATRKRRSRKEEQEN